MQNKTINERGETVCGKICNAEDLKRIKILLIMFLVIEMDIQEIEKFVWKLQFRCIFYS